MKHLASILLVLLGLAGSLAACSSTKKSQPDTRETFVEKEAVVPDTFVLPTIPGSITQPAERATYLSLHYWDRFDFGDRSLIERPEITEQAFVDYINILYHIPEESIDASLVYTLKKAEQDTAMYHHFASLFEKYLYDPNSPFRNDEFYLPVLEELSVSPLLSEAQRSAFQFHQEMASKNRVGQQANNFTYTLSNGQSFSLYDLRSEYTLLMFSNPGCSTCEAVIDRINRSEEIKTARSLNSPSRTMLAIITIYPDDDVEGWFAHLDDLPSTWINGYDDGMKITRERLYDIKAFPTLYLLDKDKNVIMKDTSIEAVESFFSING